MQKITAATSEFGGNIRKFLKLEAAAGLVLLAAAMLAMLTKNSPLSDVYQYLLLIEGEIRIGDLQVEKPLFLWVNDLWMTIFFFLVTMEIKREAIDGYLSDRSQLTLPALAAAGGIIVPAMIYVAFNWGNPAALKGWAVPTATDIAFALGIVALLGSRVPLSLKIFLMTLAVLDDLAAIVVIALFYTTTLSLVSLFLAAIGVTVLIALNRLGVTHVAGYILVGAALWICVLKSGVHATLAGVVIALAIPGRSLHPDRPAPLKQLIHMLHPWVAFGILPTFAFVNAGIDLSQVRFDRLLDPVPVGIALGLFAGKQLGVFGFAWVTVKLGFAKMPPGTTWVQFYGIAALCGVGFTMSLFIGGLAFAEGGAGYARVDRLAIIAASILSGITGYLVLRLHKASSDHENR